MADVDYIIVGAGSAGGVVAARLSADPTRSVLLIEAGPDYATGAETPPDLLDGGRLAGMAHDWNYSAAPCAGRMMPYRRGRVVGGTSAINAAAALWPRPADVERWVALGNTDWSWAEVEPWLRRVEADQDAPDRSIHGTDGDGSCRGVSRRPRQGRRGGRDGARHRARNSSITPEAGVREDWHASASGIGVDYYGLGNGRERVMNLASFPRGAATDGLLSKCLTRKGLSDFSRL